MGRVHQVRARLRHPLCIVRIVARNTVRALRCYIVTNADRTARRRVLHEGERITLLEFLRCTTAMNSKIDIRKALFAGNIRDFQQGIRIARRRVLKIEMKVLDAAEVANRRCARAVCSRAAHRRVAEVDPVIVRARAAAADNVAHDHLFNRDFVARCLPVCDVGITAVNRA